MALFTIALAADEGFETAGSSGPNRKERFPKIQPFAGHLRTAKDGDTGLSLILAYTLVFCIHSFGQTTPYKWLRDVTLEYYGPSPQLTNLTELKIAWFGPTNLNASATGDLWWAARFAVDQANAKVPKTPPGTADVSSLPFRLIPCWAVDPWGTGASVLARTIYEENPIALLGSIDSASTHIAEQIAAKAQIPIVSPIATDKSVTLAGVSWVFACAPTDSAIATVMVDEVLRALDHDKDKIVGGRRKRLLVLLSSTDHDSRMTSREILTKLSAQGRLPDYKLQLPPALPSYEDRVRPLTQNIDPTAGIVLIVVASADDSVPLLKALTACLRGRGLNAHKLPSLEPKASSEHLIEGGVIQSTVFGSHSMTRTCFLKNAGTCAEGVRVPILFTADAGNPGTSAFITDFCQARGYPPDYAAALTYDATCLLIDAIRRAGPNRAHVREALVKSSPWKGITGTIHFDGTGQNTRTNIVMGVVRNGTIVRLDYASFDR